MFSYIKKLLVKKTAEEKTVDNQQIRKIDTVESDDKKPEEKKVEEKLSLEEKKEKYYKQVVESREGKSDREYYKSIGDNLFLVSRIAGEYCYNPKKGEEYLSTYDEIQWRVEIITAITHAAEKYNYTVVEASLCGGVHDTDTGYKSYSACYDDLKGLAHAADDFVAADIKMDEESDGWYFQLTTGGPHVILVKDINIIFFVMNSEKVLVWTLTDIEPEILTETEIICENARKREQKSV